MDQLDLKAIAISKLQSSLRGLPGLVAFITEIGRQGQELDDACLAMDKRLRGVIPADSDGPSWLQNVAVLAGTSRDDTDSDATAVNLIQAAINANVSVGELKDIYAIAGLLYGGLANVWMSDGGDETMPPPSGLATMGGGVYVWVEPATGHSFDPIDANYFRRMRNLLERAKSAGVNLVASGLVGPVGTHCFFLDGTGGSLLDSDRVLYTVA